MIPGYDYENDNASNLRQYPYTKKNYKTNDYNYASLAVIQYV